MAARGTRTACSIVALAAGLVAATPAFAQAAPASAPAAAGIGEIVVTAQKRAQNLQDVPIAVTAVDSKQLQTNRVTNVNDLTGLAPGLMSRENPGGNASPSFSMRGVFATASQASQDREISIYLDGVYVSGTRGSIFNLPDMDRIEVLRGPQGTLFGRNATAGAISVVTRDPTGQFAATQEVTVGNLAQIRTRTTVDTPQIGPFSGYITYVHDSQHGDVRNLGQGVCFDRTSPFSPNLGETCSPKYLGSHRTDGIFAALKFQPTDNFKMVNKFDWADTHDTPSARVSVAINNNSLVGSLLSQLVAAQPPGGGAYGPVVQDPSNQRPDAINNGWSQWGYVKAYGDSLTSTWQLTDHLSLKNITAYRQTKTIGISTFTGLDGIEFNQASVAPYARFAAISAYGAGFFSMTPAQQASTIAGIAAGLQPSVGKFFMTYGGNQSSYEHQWSSETQVNYQSRLLTLTVGGLWYTSKEGDDGIPGMSPTFAFTPIGPNVPLGNIQNSISKTTSLAAYAQGEIHVTRQLDIVLGGRITKDKKTGLLESGGTVVGDQLEGVTSTPWSFSKTKPTFSVGLNYKPDRDILLYGKYSTAFLSGGAVGPLSFKPETVASEEVGLKSEFLDRRLRVNLALYNAVYHHNQSAQSGSVVLDPTDPTHMRTLAQYGVVVIDNGTLKSRGFELEVTAAPAHGVTIGGSAGYDHAYYVDPNPLATQGLPYKLVGVVPWTASVYGQYQSDPIFGDARLFFRLDANYQGRYRQLYDPNTAINTPAFAPYEFSPARWILNGRVALQDIKAGPATGELGIWVRNLTNNRDVLYMLNFGGYQLDASYQQARTFGIDLTFHLK